MKEKEKKKGKGAGTVTATLIGTEMSSMEKAEKQNMRI